MILPAFCLPVALAARKASAQLLYQLDGFAYTQNFNTLASNGNNNTTLPPEFKYVEAGSSGNLTYAADNGNNTSGDTYSYGAAAGNPERALGELTTSTVQSTIGCGFINNTGFRISTITVGYTGEQWRLAATGTVDRLDFQYSRDATSLTAGTFVDVDELDFNSPNNSSLGQLDGNSPANRAVFAPFAITFSTPMDTNQFVFLRWRPLLISGTNTNDGLAIDDLTFGYTLSNLNGDFNNDQKVDATDIDLLLRATPGVAQPAEQKFDMSHDGLIELRIAPNGPQSDADIWVRKNRQTQYGDANLDRRVNTADFTTLAAHFNQTNQGWLTGDFNGDDKVNALDFNILAKGFGFNADPFAPPLGSLVPEPASVLACAVAMLILPRRRGSMFERLR